MQKKNKIGFILGFLFLMGTSCFTKSMDVGCNSITLRLNDLREEVNSTKKPRKLLKKIINEEKELIRSSKNFKICGLALCVVGGAFCFLSSPVFPVLGLIFMGAGGVAITEGDGRSEIRDNKGFLYDFKKQLINKIQIKQPLCINSVSH